MKELQALDMISSVSGNFGFSYLQNKHAEVNIAIQFSFSVYQSYSFAYHCFSENSNLLQ